MWYVNEKQIKKIVNEGMMPFPVYNNDVFIMENMQMIFLMRVQCTWIEKHTQFFNDHYFFPFQSFIPCSNSEKFPNNQLINNNKKPIE